MKTINYAPDALKILHGFFCVYKPSGLHHLRVRSMLAFNLSRDLNDLEVRPVRDMVTIEGSVASGKPLSVKLSQNFADHPLVVGSRHQPQDLRLKSVNYLTTGISGVMVMAVGDACWKAKEFQARNLLHTMEVKGQLGLATQNFMLDGKVVEKATFDNVRQERLDRLIASIQATHQASAFEYSNVPIESQEAYEMASRGLVRPSGKTPTLLYDIKCTEFNVPHFTLQMRCINPTEEYLAQMIHEIGIYMRSCAVCTQIRCTQYGHFTLDHALLRKHWTLEHILSNIVLCKEILNSEDLSSDNTHIQQVPKDISKSSIKNMQEAFRSDLL